MRKLAVFLLLCLPPPAWGQTPVALEVKGDGVKQITLVSKFPVFVSGQSGADLYFWSASPGVTFTDRGDSVEVLSAPQGESSVYCRMLFIDWTGKKVVSKFGVVTFSVGNLPPGPNPPDPKPPDPKPPIPTTGLKVLIVEESADRTKLTPSQLPIILGKPMRDWLNSNCSDDPSTDSKKGWFIVDKDQSMSGVPKFWGDALEKGKTSFPCIVIMDGQGVVIQVAPLPADVEATKTLLGKYVPSKRKAA